MTTTSLPAMLKRRLQAALADTNLANLVFGILAEAVNTKPTTEWFHLAVKDDYIPATAGTWSWAAGAQYGRIFVDSDGTLAFVHAHVDKAHASGTMELELWRNRGQVFGAGGAPGTMTRIGTVAVGDSEVDGASPSFTLTDDALLAGDYLHLQPVGAKPGGSGWSTHVDLHFAEVTT